MANYIRWFSSKAKGNNAGHYQDFSYADGPTFEDNLNEQLDSGTIILNKKFKIDFEPFDIVEIYCDGWDKSKTMLVDRFVENQVCFEPVKYDYTVSLMSLTKLLERIIVPNFSVTRPVSDSGIVGNAISLKSAINNLLEDYAPKYLTEISGISSYKKLLTLDETDERLNQDCPDLQMSKPTLREAIDRILSVIGCICKLNEDNVIELVDINKKGNSFDLDNYSMLNYVNENQSSEDYASELDNEYNNVTPNRITTNINNTTRIVEYIGFRNNNDGVVSDENLQIETKYPIYSLKQIIMTVPVRAQTLSGHYDLLVKVDITKYVLEEQKWNLLDYGDIDELDGAEPCKLNSVFYARGNNVITNWSVNVKRLFKQTKTIERIVKSKPFKNAVIKVDSSAYPIPLPNLNYRRASAFTVIYEAQVDKTRASSHKLLPETHENNSIIDNASEAFVDIYNQGKLFHDKVNRLGNRAKIITGRFNINQVNLMPKLGDYIVQTDENNNASNFVVINTEMQWYDNFVIYKATLTENYVNINYFTGINARKRSWNIVSANEAFDKQLLEKYYCEFSFEEKIDKDNEKLLPDNYIISDYLAKTLASIDNYGGVDDTIYTQSILITNNHIKESNNNVDFINLENQKFISGNSLIFTFGMLDNYSSTTTSLVRDQNNDSSFNEDEGGNIEYWNKYTNETGENELLTYNIVFVTYHFKPADGYSGSTGFNFDNVIDLDVGNYLSLENVHAPSGSNKPKYYELYQGFKPRVRYEKSNEDYDFTDKKSFFACSISNHKDNREKINFNVQFEYCTDTKDIVFTRLFLERNQFISVKNLTGGFDIYISPNRYEYGDEYLQENSTKVNNIHFNIESTKDGSAKCQLWSDNHTTSHKSVAIISKIGQKLIMAINNSDIDLGDERLTWYLNILKTRDRKVYIYNSMKYWK